MTPAELTRALKTSATRLGFCLAGACPAVEPAGWGRFVEWLEAGYAGQMQFLADRREAYGHPRHVLDGARSLLVLAMNYHTGGAAPAAPGQGRVAQYAGQVDYHDLIHDRLHQLADEYRRLVPGGQARGVVDTAPLLEREFAQMAGLGWIGKNTLVLNRQWGSWFFLAVLLVDQPLEYDQPHAADHCGTCRACLDACPTGAFMAPYVLDSRRCLSYLTIEHRGPVPLELRPAMQEWVFGCDVCQEVCPWNQRAPLTGEAELRPLAECSPLELAGLFELSDETFRERFRRSPLWRARRRGLLRSAALILGNHRAPAALGALERGAADAEPLVRGAAAWALGRWLPDQAARRVLERRMGEETDADVLHEIGRALEGGLAHSEDAS